MVESASETLREAGIEEPIGTVLADGGYWNSPAMSEVRRQVIDVLVPTRTVDAPPDASSHRAKAPKQNEAALSTREGQGLYRRRQQLVEPVFRPHEGDP